MVTSNSTCMALLRGLARKLDHLFCRQVLGSLTPLMFTLFVLHFFWSNCGYSHPTDVLHAILGAILLSSL